MVTELGDGTYAVRFYDRGQEVYVRLDGEMPVWNASSTGLVYAKLGAENELWVAVVEKAYAHFRYGLNTYASLSGGWMRTTNLHIADTSSLSYYLPFSESSPESLWATLGEHIQSGNALTLASKGSPPGPVIGNHAYVVYGVSSSEEGMFVTVFNPWGYDGASWDSNYQDGLLTLSLDQFFENFNYALASLA